jgi:hypothetical protein
MHVSKNIITFLGFALLISLLAGCKGKEKWSPEDGLPWIPKDLASATEMINNNCPEWVDAETRLDSVSLFQDSLTFYYSLPNKVKNTFSTDAFAAYLIPGIIENIQGNSRLDLHRDSSIFMFFNYRDRNGDFVTSFVVRPEMYYKPESE